MKDQMQFPKGGANLEDIIRFQEDMLKRAREVGDRLSEGQSLQFLGQYYMILGETQRGADCMSQALMIARETGDWGTQAYALYGISSAAMEAGVVNSNTLDMARTALKIFEGMGDPGADLVRALLAKYDKKKWWWPRKK
jgi:hypothetical protein